MLVAVVEIKCKRCGKTTLFKDSPKGSLVSFTLFIDMDGGVADVCQVAPIALVYSRSQLIGSPIKNICPLLCDNHKVEEMRASFDNGMPYDIKQNIFLTRDGGKLLVRSHCIGVYCDRTFAGYRMFNWIGNDSEFESSADRLSTA